MSKCNNIFKNLNFLLIYYMTVSSTLPNCLVFFLYNLLAFYLVLDIDNHFFLLNILCFLYSLLIIYPSPL